MLTCNINGEYKIFKNKKLEYTFSNFILKSAFYNSNSNSIIPKALERVNIDNIKLTTSIDIDLSADYNPIEFPTIKTINELNTSGVYFKEYNIPVYEMKEDENFYYYELNSFFRYDAKENLGNFTAIMAGNFSASYVKDANGNRATFSKLEDEILDILYTIRLKFSKKCSLTLNGVTYDNLIVKDTTDEEYKKTYINANRNGWGINNLLNLIGYNTTCEESIHNYEFCTFSIYNKTNNRYLGNTRLINSYNVEYNYIVDSTNSNKFNYNLSTTLNSDVNLRLFNSQDMYLMHFHVDSDTTFEATMFDISLNEYMCFKKLNSVLNFDEYIINYINKINSKKLTDTEYFNNFLAYDINYKIIKNRINFFRKKYPDIFSDTLSINSDMSYELTFDDVIKFLANLENFKKQIKNISAYEYYKYFYKFIIQFPDNFITVPAGKNIFLENTSKFTLNFTFNAG